MTIMPPPLFIIFCGASERSVSDHSLQADLLDRKLAGSTSDVMHATTITRFV